MSRGRPRNRHGGYRKPSSPAPTSGPGALARRTDGGPADPQPQRLPSGGDYGDRKNLQAQQSAAPMAGSPDLPRPQTAGGAAPPAAAAPPVGDIFAPTTRPDEPLTAGLPMGPGSNGPLLPPDRAAGVREVYIAAVRNGWPGAEHLRELLERMG